MEFSAEQIAALLHGKIEGDSQAKVKGFSKIEEGKPETITFLANLKYEHYIYETGASVVLVNNDFKPSSPIKATLIRVENAYAALADLLKQVESHMPRKTGVASTASIASTATYGENCYIGDFAFIGENVTIGNNCMIYPHTYIGDNVTIGDGCILYPHATIYYNCTVGRECILHAGSVIGADGFGFAPNGDGYDKIPQLGNVIIEDQVEIGANTTIDRAVMNSTVIRRGVKLDNLIQVAHNVEVGEHTVMAAQVGIAGSVKIGKHCMFGGQAGLAGHITIGDNVQIGAQAGIMRSIDKPVAVLGAPAIPAKDFFKSNAVFNKLPEMALKLARLEKEMERLKNELNKDN